MRTFEININSNLRAVPVAIVFFGLSIYLIGEIPRDLPDFLSYVIIAILFLFPIIPTTLLSRGKIRVELAEDAFRTIWIRRFFLSNKQNIELDWNRVIDYVNQEDRGLDSFRLTLTNNQQYKFYRYTYFPQKDDFENFLYYLPVFLQKVELAKERTIEKGKTEFQSRSFKWVLIGLTIIAIGLLVNTLMNPNSGTRWASLGVIFSGIFFYWQQATRKK
ncbi:hypothetical protein [Reichenbachiella sp.]|uniref:hypothetical protein n=1 Tax=Reichenbachiella sp. TaxID=2184521 RepID=UPI003B59CBDE